MAVNDHITPPWLQASFSLGQTMMLGWVTYTAAAQDTAFFITHCTTPTSLHFKKWFYPAKTRAQQSFEFGQFNLRDLGFNIQIVELLQKLLL